MSRWTIKADGLDERPDDYSATFVLTNVDSGAAVRITLSQLKGGPATDLIGGCRALAQTLERMCREEPSPGSASYVGGLN